MIRKGRISTIDLNKKTATVTFENLDNVVTPEIPLMTIPIRNANYSTNTGGGNISIDYIPDYRVNDLVIVTFFDGSFSDGVVIGKVGVS